MEIVIAKTAGFCFGVDMAVNTINELINQSHDQIYTLGPIIHNEQFVGHLRALGVKVIDRVKEAEVPGNIVIRAHGVQPEIYNEIEEKGLKLVDATCPYVTKIHSLAKEKISEGYTIIIVGDKTHPEVQGINGWCENKAHIVNNEEDVNLLDSSLEKVCVLAQTTITSEKWESINKILEERFINLIRFDTICNATNRRQIEAAEIAKTVDYMIVIGGKNSSNTQKLYEICKKYCNETVKIEVFGDLSPVEIKKYKKVGITAGASTPGWVIKEVLDKMSELNKQENEMSFKDAFESSLVTLRTGEIVKGKIVGFNNAEVFVDMGFKSDGIIPMEEFTEDPDFKPEESLKVGDELQVFVIRVNDGEGNVLLSKKKVDAVKSWDVLEEAYKNKTAVQGKIVEIVNGGAIAFVNGVKLFIPASHMSDKYTKDLSEFLKQTVTLRVIEFNKQKRKFVGSCRVIIEEEKSGKADSIWNAIEVGKNYRGVIKSFTDFGAFVDIGGIDGLVHVSELSWTKVKHPSEVLTIGETIDVSILEFDKGKKRISLGYRKAEDNPWIKVSEKYKVGDIVKGVVVRLVPFGAFIELESGIDGLVHISQISNKRINKPSDALKIGQQIEAKITEINLETKKISLSIKELIIIEPAENIKVGEEIKTEAQAPSEHKEEMSNTIGESIKTGELC